MSSKKHAPKTDLELAIAAIRAEEKLAIKALQQLTAEEIKEMKKEGASSANIKKRKNKALGEIKAHRYRMNIRIKTLKQGKISTSFGNFDSPKPKPMHAQGPFNSFGKLKGYEAAGQSAGNRIERAHPGFYEAVKDLPGILIIIFEVYTNKFHNATDDFYETHGDDYMDEDRYQVLLNFIHNKYGVEILV